MTAAVRKKDEEMAINLKCTIGVPMTDWGGKCRVVTGRGRPGLSVSRISYNE